MTKKNLNVIFCLFLILSFAFMSCAGSRGRRSHNKWKQSKEKWHAEKTDGLSLPASDVKLTMNDRVISWLNYFQGPGRERFGRYLMRSGRYIPLMKKILRERGLPEDVVYIALIESGFTASAKSHASAVGFWQFIRSTGSRYNLRIDPFVDERQCPIKSTYAAANYLTDLYRMFGDWYLAFAGYNSGEGKVQRAIKRYGTKDFWTMTSPRHDHFRAETKDYVPKYIAAAIIAKNPKKYGFNVDYHEPLIFDEVRATTQTDFEVVAKASGSDYSEVSMLNPHLLMGVTPPGEKNFIVRVPEGKGHRFERMFAKIPTNKRLTKDYSVAFSSRSSGYHTVKKGETAAKIASRYGVSVKQLLSSNGIRTAKHLKRGQRLKIPGSISEVAYTSKSSDKSSKSVSASNLNKTVKYRIKKGDTLGSIADNHGVSVDDLKRWNKIRGNHIVMGKALKIYTNESPAAPVETDVAAGAAQLASATDLSVPDNSGKTDYKVKKGDTLSKIANQHGVTVQELKEWNNLNENTIAAGKTLRVRPAAFTPVGSAAAVDSSVGSKPQEPEFSKTYTVKKGDTWWSIAQKNNVTVADLQKWNSNVSKYLKVGQKIKLGASVPEVAKEEVSSPDISYKSETQEPKKASDSGNSYKVKSGDTLSSIAKQVNIGILELCSLNGISRTAVLKVGTVLKIKGKALPATASKTVSKDIGPSDRVMMSKPTSSPQAQGAKTLLYKVKSGDTAWNIAKKHNVSVDQIKNWNSKTDLAKIKPGDVIKLNLASRSET